MGLVRACGLSPQAVRHEFPTNRLSNSRIVGICRQSDRHNSPLFRLAAHIDLSVMGLNDGAANRQAKAGSIGRRACRVRLHDHIHPECSAAVHQRRHHLSEHRHHFDARRRIDDRSNLRCSHFSQLPQRHGQRLDDGWFITQRRQQCGPEHLASSGDSQWSRKQIAAIASAQLAHQASVVTRRTV